MNGIITNTEGAINIDLLIRLIHWTINMDSLIWWYFMIFHCYLWYGGVLNWKHPQSSSILFDDFPWNSPAIKGYPQDKTESLIYMSHIVLWLKQYWLVVDLPLWKIWFPQLGLIIPNIWKNKKCSKPPIRTINHPQNHHSWVVWLIFPVMGGLWHCFTHRKRTIICWAVEPKI